MELKVVKIINEKDKNSDYFQRLIESCPQKVDITTSLMDYLKNLEKLENVIIFVTYTNLIIFNSNINDIIEKFVGLEQKIIFSGENNNNFLIGYADSIYYFLSNGLKDIFDLRTIKKLIDESKPKINNLIDSFRKVSNHLQENNIKFILSGGTLLGHTRNGEIIPWDDDIDIEILEEDSIKLSKIEWKDSLQYCGWNGPAQAYFVKDLKNNCIIDIFSSRNKNESIVGGNIKFPGTNSKIEKSSVFPFKKDHFHGIEVYIPNDPIDVCKKFYGNESIEECYVWNHTFNDKWRGGFNKNKITIPTLIVKDIVNTKIQYFGNNSLFGTTKDHSILYCNNHPRDKLLLNQQSNYIENLIKGYSETIISLDKSVDESSLKFKVQLHIFNKNIENISDHILKQEGVLFTQIIFYPIDNPIQRDLSLKIFLESDADYYFTVEKYCELKNKDTILELIKTKKKIIAPFLNKQTTISNFWNGLDLNGFYERSFDYLDIVTRNKIGVLNVPYINYCYLIHKDICPQILNFYTKNIKSGHGFDMAFCENCRNNDIFLWIDNRINYGYLL